MHSLLEDYIAEVSKQLEILPKAKRNEELREMQQHLLSAVTLYQEQGQSEDEAAQSAVAQFGTPADLGGNIVQAWRRGQAIRRRDLGKSAILALILSLLLPRLLLTLSKSYWSYAFRTHEYMLGYLELSAPFFLVGIISGLILPRRAIAGTGLAICVCVLYTLTRLVIEIPFHEMGLGLLIQATMEVIVAILGAGIGSIWRERHWANAY
jgi:hypothetical protein